MLIDGLDLLTIDLNTAPASNRIILKCNLSNLELSLNKDNFPNHQVQLTTSNYADLFSFVYINLIRC